MYSIRMALPGVVRLLLPLLLLAAALTSAVLVLTITAAQADPLSDDTLSTENVQPTPAEAASGAGPAELAASAAGSSDRPGNTATDKLSAPVPTIRGTAGGVASAGRETVTETSPAAAKTGRTSPVEKVADTTRETVTETSSPVTETGSTSPVERVADTANDTVGEVEKVASDVPVVRDVVPATPLVDAVDQVVGRAHDVVDEVGTVSEPVEDVTGAVDQAVSQVSGAALEQATRTHRDELVEAPGAASPRSGSDRASVAGSRVPRWATDQFQILDTGMPGAGSLVSEDPRAVSDVPGCTVGANIADSADNANNGGSTDNADSADSADNPGTSPPAGITTNAPGAGGGPGGGAAAALSSTWLPLPMTALQSATISLLGPISGPTFDPGFSPD